MDRGINNNDLKQKNRGLVLRLIATGECDTRMSLTKKSNLTRMSITNIIDEFIDMNLVVEGEKKKKDIQGRRPALLEFSPAAPKVIGVLINREYCAAVLCDLCLNVIKIERREMEQKDKDRFLDNIYELIDSMMQGEKNILGIGVASIGPLDVNRGVLLSPPRFGGIKNIALVSLIEEKYGLPVFLDHQYNSAARAEKLFGCGRDVSSFVFVGVTNGIGAGIYLNDRILQSRTGLGSELGHMSVDYKGVPCECDNFGCIENYASTNVICQNVETATGRKMSFAQCCECREGSVIDQIIKDAIDKLSICLTSVSNLLNPETIIMGHESVKLPERYLQRMEEYINQHKLSADYYHIHVQKPCFGEESQLVGAACSVLEQVFEGRILFH